jgi:hypothetical protein
MKSFKQMFPESYILKFERDRKSNQDILHVHNTKTGGRTEVRGKPNYEGSGYDPSDKLHQLIDKVGKSANISELMNGQKVAVNPRHPSAHTANKELEKIDKGK